MNLARADDGNTYRYHATGLPAGGDRDQIALDAARQIEEVGARFLKGPQRTARIQLIVLAAMKAQSSGGTCSGGEG